MYEIKKNMWWNIISWKLEGWQVNETNRAKVKDKFENWTYWIGELGLELLLR